jgi:hypothetical protein
MQILQKQTQTTKRFVQSSKTSVGPNGAVVVRLEVLRLALT